MKNEIFVGIDLGTTGTKVILLQADGKVIDKDYVEYPIRNPAPGFAEQNPRDWWDGLCKISNNIMARNQDLVDRIVGIGIDGQMHTQVFLGDDNRPLRNAITWMDQRSSELVAEINKDEAKKKAIFESTANFLTTTYTAPQIVWVRNNEPEVYQQTSKILIAKDYLKYRLTGEMITDYSDAAGTLLFDVRRKKWADETFNIFGIKRSLMPEVEKSALVIGHITPEASRETGLPEGTPVINGCADHAATSLGSGVINPGQVAAIIGTAGVISVLSDEPVPDPDKRSLCWNYCLDNKWVIMGIMQTAGESLNWFKGAFDSDMEREEDVFDIYNKEIGQIPGGSEGLIFLPYLMGERTPYWDSDARGVFFGISLNHKKYHFVRAIMEGVSFGLKNNIEAVESLGLAINDLRLLGGGSKSKEWIDILARVLNKKISTVTVEETGALGSSILCGLALGIYDSLDDAVTKLVKVKERGYYQEMPEAYCKNYHIFKKLYPSLKNLFKKNK